MSQIENKEQDMMIEEFLSVFKQTLDLLLSHETDRAKKIDLFIFFKREKRARFTQDKKKRLFEDIEAMSTSIYNNFCLKSRFIFHNYFPYFSVLKQDSKYHFHFLIYKKNYI